MIKRRRCGEDEVLDRFNPHCWLIEEDDLFSLGFCLFMVLTAALVVLPFGPSSLSLF